MTRESMLEILKDMGKDSSCLEGECEIDPWYLVSDIICTTTPQILFMQQHPSEP